MSDGPAVDVDLAWDMAAAPFRVAGNYGPLFEWNEVDRHFVDRCITVVQSAHQAYRYPGVLTGTVDGVDVTTLFSPDNEPFINRGVFSLVIAPHGECE
jgi:hypothetical protein